MDEFNGYETDEELEQALYTALVREPAPDTLLLRVEERLFATHRAPAIPGLRLLTASTWSVWSSLWSVAAHGGVELDTYALAFHSSSLRCQAGGARERKRHHDCLSQNCGHQLCLPEGQNNYV